MSAASLLTSLCGIVLSLVLGVLFSAMESGVLALNRTRLMQLFGDEHPEPTTEQDIFRDAKEIYFVSRLGICLTLVAAGFSTFHLIFSPLEAMSVEEKLDPNTYLFSSVLLTLLILPPVYLFCVFGLPRLLIRQTPIGAEEDLPWWMRRFIHVVRPLSLLARISALFPLGRVLPQHQLTKNDLVALVTDLDIDEEEDGEGPAGASAEGAGAAPAPIGEDTDEEVIIYNILDLDDTFVREVMKPINSVVAVRLETATVQRVRDLARRTGYSRFPVYHDRIVELAGFVSIYDILRSGDETGDLAPFVSEAYYVPEFMRVNDLLQEFLNRKVDAAIVIDEYGGSSGWITREDVMEEIVGEIEDEFDARRRRLHREEDDSYVADGAIDIDDLSEELPIQFPDPQYDTLAGFILMHLGRMPREGDWVESEDASFAVEKLEGNRISRIRIRLHPVRKKNGG